MANQELVERQARERYKILSDRLGKPIADRDEFLDKLNRHPRVTRLPQLQHAVAALEAEWAKAPKPAPKGPEPSLADRVAALEAAAKPEPEEAPVEDAGDEPGSRRRRR